ncbi:MAG: hypothetical protein MZW92_20865 [Comamonadaceae bacterium]|nr:hypothetical protein [Comamonadaceae bacterium]
MNALRQRRVAGSRRPCRPRARASAASSRLPPPRRRSAAPRGSMIALASPCGVWYRPPSWCAIACTLPTLARVKASPA